VARGGIPIARFYNETYIDGDYIFPVSWIYDPTKAQTSSTKTLSDLVRGRSSTSSLSKTAKLYKRTQDKTATVALAAPPEDHTEDAEAARTHGLQYVWSKQDAVDPSVFTVSFIPKEDPEIKQHIAEVKKEFYTAQPQGIISDIKLSPTLTSHLQKQHVPFASLLFDAKEAHGKMAFVLQTPGGFWNLNWHSTAQKLYQDNVPFAKMVKNVRVDVKEEYRAKLEQSNVKALPEPTEVAEEEEQATANDPARSMVVFVNVPPEDDSNMD